MKGKWYILFFILLFNVQATLSNEVVDTVTVDSINYELFSDGTAAVLGERGQATYTELDYGKGFTKGLHTGVIASFIKYDNKKYKVVGIESFAFYNCESLTRIDIPGSVKYINDFAFALSSLKEVTIAEGMTWIGGFIFWHCYSLKKCVIPESVTFIGGYAFGGCYYLTNVELPANLTTINKGTFSSCSSLTHVTLPKKLENVGEYAFSSCYKLTSLILPEGLKTITTDAFENCSNLTKIQIPSTVTSIGKDAFTSCPNISDITCHIVKPFAINDTTFDSITYKQATLRVADVLAYKTTK